jgi:ribosomal protein S12 methylthiotransferase
VPARKASVHFRSLGCPKNQLDTEVMLGGLALAGYAIAERLEDADVAVVNTCSFIESAREESIQAILEVADLRETGRLRGLVVAGCLPQRYGAELAKELPEVDAFVGTGAFQGIAGILDDALAGRSRGVYVEAGRTHLYDDATPRILVGPGHSAYVKILPGRPGLADLVRALDAVEGLDWVRLLYLYPSAVDDDLIAALGAARRVLPYVDVPLQHASDPVLRAMKRGTTAARQRRLVERLRAGIPGLTLRTTFIVGFPGETDADFEALCEFVREARFDRVGVFRYSDEEGTAAAGYGAKVPRSVARARYRRLAALQREIMAETLAAQVGREADVLVDAPLGRGRALGRLASQAPEIDGVTYLHARGVELAPGALLRARITKVRGGVDLEAEAVTGQRP